MNAGPVLTTMQLEAAFASSGLRGLAAIGEPLGHDPSRITDSSGDLIVSAIWAQRAMNAVGLRTFVDGVAGGETIGNLRTYYSRIGGASTGIAPSVQIRGTSTSPGRVKISSGMESRLSAHSQVADPPRQQTYTSPDPEASASGYAPPPAGPSSSGAMMAVGLAVVFGIVAAQVPSAVRRARR